MNKHNEKHPFDLATQLTWDDGKFTGQTSPHYENMIGPFGGVIAATLLKAIMEHPDREGEPVSLTINYAAPVSDDAFNIHTTPTK